MRSEPSSRAQTAPAAGRVELDPLVQCGRPAPAEPLAVPVGGEVGTAEDERKNSRQRQVGLRQRHLAGGDVHRVVLAGLLLQRYGIAPGLVLGIFQSVRLGAGGVPAFLGAGVSGVALIANLARGADPVLDVEVDLLLDGGDLFDRLRQ